MGMVSEGSVSFSNMSVQSESGNFSGDREWRRLKFEAGKSYRIKFIDREVEMRHRHYNPVEGKSKGYYRCLGHTGYCPVCAAAANGWGGEGKYKLKKAQEMFGANVLVYNTDAQGNPTQPLNAEVYFWAFNAQKFVQIRSIQQDWGDITQLDLKLTCADAQAAQFQNVSISNLPQCLYNSDPALKAACDAKIEKDKYPLAKMLCREVGVQDMIAAFGLPQTYLPQDMQAQMPSGQMTVMDYATQAPQAPVTPPVAPPVQVQMPQAPAYSQPVQQVSVQSQVAPQQAPVQSQVAPQQVYSAPAAQPAPQPVSQVQSIQEAAPAPVAPPVAPPVQAAPQTPPPAQAPVQTPVQAPADAYADLDALQNILG